MIEGGNGKRCVVVIMAGGAGERFWPLSRRNCPKQILHLAGGGKSLLDEAMDRARKMVPSGRIYISTGRNLETAIRAACPGLPGENIIGEPVKRNTLGCLVYTAARIASERDDDPVMAILTADHHVGDLDRFTGIASVAVDVAAGEDVLVAIGIPPTRPATEFGYLEIPEGAGSISCGVGGVSVFPVERFVEKPDLETAGKYVSTGRYLWNSGMFFWRISTFVRELRKASPATVDILDRMVEAFRAGDRTAADKAFEDIQSTSIDYALMERSKRVLAVRGDFPWDDVGAWDAMDRTFAKDCAGNVKIGEPVLIDVKNSIVYNAPGARKMAVAVIGLDDILVVTSEDGILVAPKSRCQDVKKAVSVISDRDVQHT